jgi:hypothetical protein
MERELLVTCAACRRLHVPVDPLAFESICALCSGAHPLRALDMNGSFPLTHETIDEVLSRTSPGNYALGYQDGATFLVFYVGRSDSDVRARLHEWVDAPSRCARTAPQVRAPWFAQRSGRFGPVATALALAPAFRPSSAYTRFAYSYASSGDAAFAKECRNFEDFGGARELDNAAHPATPDRPGFGPPTRRPGPLRMLVSRPPGRPRPHISAL